MDTPTHVLVVGDSMLDRYWEGRAERLSPEAPVPVLRVTRESSRAGGAANVALNLAALGANVSLLTLVGDDEPGTALRQLIQQAGVRLDAVGGSRHRTTQKIRCVAQRHQLLRTDFEEQACDECVTELHAEFARVLMPGSVVVLSDYAKGALRDCTSLIALARSMGCCVLVDPKGTDFTRYRGADVLKPNMAEVQTVLGPWADENEFVQKCTALRRKLRIGALLVTRGEEGMTLFDEQGISHHATQPHEVADVSGAGDTAMAALASFLARGVTLGDAVCWANRAASLAVCKFGTAVVSLDELVALHGPLPGPAPQPVSRPARAARSGRARSHRADADVRRQEQRP
jgi:D-glycero-beta-D-manno-heptose-7-phosphate kinase